MLSEFASQTDAILLPGLSPRKTNTSKLTVKSYCGIQEDSLKPAVKRRSNRADQFRISQPWADLVNLASGKSAARNAVSNSLFGFLSGIGVDRQFATGRLHDCTWMGSSALIDGFVYPNHVPVAHSAAGDLVF